MDVHLYPTTADIISSALNVSLDSLTSGKEQRESSKQQSWRRNKGTLFTGSNSQSVLI